MNEKRMYRGIRQLTWLLMAIAMAAMSLLAQEYKYVPAGVAIGALSGVLGFQKIIAMSERIDGSVTDLKLPAFSEYAKRYVLYLLVFGISAYAGVDILAMLVGFSCHKAAILLYVWMHRKEAE